MKAQGIRLVPIIDAAVKVEEGYDVYEEGVKNGYFCTNQDGTPFVDVYKRQDSEAVLSVGLFVLHKFLEFC